MSVKPFSADDFKRNNDEFRNTMEAIFQKYSNLSDPGIDVCLKTMTCRTEKGPVPVNSKAGERELEALKTRVNACYSMRELEDQDNDQMDVSEVTEDDSDGSSQKKKSSSENLLHSGESFQFSLNLNNTSDSSLWGERFQPKEEDEELESSHGSTLLDLFPSMVNQIGESSRRQHVTDVARGEEVQKYRRKHWQAGPAHRNTSFKNQHDCTLNKTTDISFTNQSPVQRNIINCFKGRDKFPNPLKNKPKSSALKNLSNETRACFYSPRRNIVDVNGLTDESTWTDLRLTGKPEQNTVRVIDLSTPPSSGSSSIIDQSPDLDQTYDVGPTSHAIPASSVFTSPRQSTAGLPIIDQRGMSITSRPSSLDKDCFRGNLHSPIFSPHRGLIGVSSPSGKSSFRPSVLSMESQLNSTASPKGRSPLHHLARSEVLRSPYGAKQVLLSSPRRSVYNRADQSLCKAERPSHFSPSKRQRSLSGPQSTNSFSEQQLDAEFRKVYHHFVCRGTSSPLPSSHCHLCERPMKEMSRSPSVSSSSMSALALTPLKAKKRQRQPEVEESLRFKRFRESRSTLKHLQLTGKHVTSAMSELTQEKLIWDRAVLLQCPSPLFLRGTGNLRRIREANLRKLMNPCAMSWRDAPSEVCPVEAAVSPKRPFIQGTAPLAPSLSRRRLQYGLPQ